MMDGGDEMDSVYDGGGSVPRETKQTSIDEQNREADEATILLSKKALGGKEFKPGDEVVLQIVSDHGEELAAKYAPEKPEAGAAPAPEEDAGTELDRMNKEY